MKILYRIVMINKIKDKLFFNLVDKNETIREEYIRYRYSDNITSRFKRIIFIIKMNLAVRLFRIPGKLLEGEANQLKLEDTTPTRNKFAPALRGPESNVFNRPMPQHFVKQLLEYDVISFDIFDTLIFRPFEEPVDLFYFLEIEFGIINFKQLRSEYEWKVRDRVKEATNGASHEVKLEDIYEELEKWVGVKKDYGVAKEIELETKFCFSNPYMKEVFDILKANNKKIIAVSDMYMSKETITNILEKNGYLGFDEIFVSCEYGFNKRSKGLYRCVEEEYTKGKSVIHIGDNHTSDVIKAREFGWESLHYRNVNHIGKQFRARQISKLIHSGYSGIINSYLHNGKTRLFSPHFEFGFIYGGLFTLGYMSHINNYAKVNNIEKILFLARDGDVWHKVYKKHFNEIESEYVFWSRNPSRMIASDILKSDYLKQYIQLKCDSPRDYTFEDTIKAMDLEELIVDLEIYGLDPLEYINQENVQQFYDFIFEKWDVIQERYAASAGAMKEYMDNIIGESKSVLVVDIGWHGTSIIGFQKVVNDILGFKCDIHGMMAATCSKDIDYITSLISSKKINIYMFSPLHNKHLLYHHRSRSTNNVLMELFCTAPHPSILSFGRSDNGQLKLNFDIPEIENYEMVREIQDGIMSFSDEYMEHFKDFPFMLNISGSDAYMPIKHIFTDLTYIRKFFDGYSYNRLLGNQKRSQMTTITDIIGR